MNWTEKGVNSMSSKNYNSMNDSTLTWTTYLSIYEIKMLLFLGHAKYVIIKIFIEIYFIVDRYCHYNDKEQYLTSCLAYCTSEIIMIIFFKVRFYQAVSKMSNNKCNFFIKEVYISNINVRLKTYGNHLSY